MEDFICSCIIGFTCTVIVGVFIVFGIIVTGLFKGTLERIRKENG